jgi:hypothetical protein
MIINHLHYLRNGVIQVGGEKFGTKKRAEKTLCKGRG